MDGRGRGYLLVIGAYGFWGVVPLFWKLLQAAAPIEILAHRIVWSAVSVALIVLALRRWDKLVELARQPRNLAGMTLAATLVAVNWGTFIYGVDSDQVVETSLGYFINPLITVCLAVLVLHERLRTVQWVALGIGGGAVAVLTVDYGRPPYIALTLAVSFGLYGLTKKRLGLPALEGLMVESAVLAPAALAYVWWLTTRGTQTFGDMSAAHGGSIGLTALMIISGPITAIPLLMFADAANRIPLSTMGLIQYLGPVLQLICGVVVFHEPMPPARLAGFTLVWCALAVFTWDGLRRTRQAARKRAAERVEPVAATSEPVAEAREPAATAPEPAPVTSV